MSDISVRGQSSKHIEDVNKTFDYSPYRHKVNDVKDGNFYAHKF